MTTTEKMTSRKALTYVLTNTEVPADVREKLEAMLASLDRKASAERKPTAIQKENAELAPHVLDFINMNNGVTCTDIMKEFDLTSNQKASAIVRILTADGSIRKEVRKGKAYFIPVQ